MSFFLSCNTELTYNQGRCATLGMYPRGNVTWVLQSQSTKSNTGLVSVSAKLYNKPTTAIIGGALPSWLPPTRHRMQVGRNSSLQPESQPHARFVCFYRTIFSFIPIFWDRIRFYQFVEIARYLYRNIMRFLIEPALNQDFSEIHF